jgi:hypothetical protein
VADATRQVAQTLRERDSETIAHYTEAVADQVEDLGRYIRGLQPGEMMREVESLVRRQPALVFGSLFIAGLAISRFLRASEPSDEIGPHVDYDSDYSDTETRPTTYSGYTGSASMTRPMT